MPATPVRAVIEKDLPNFWEVGPDDWDRWLGPNLFGVLNCCHATVPGMIANGYGRIVTVISEAGRVGEPNYAVYSGAKAGAAGIHARALAKGLGRHRDHRQLRVAGRRGDAGPCGSQCRSGNVEEETQPLRHSPAGAATAMPPP